MQHDPSPQPRLRRKCVIHKDQCSQVAADLWKSRDGRLSHAMLNNNRLC